jgi:hypothetical protein
MIINMKWVCMTDNIEYFTKGRVYECGFEHRYLEIIENRLNFQIRLINDIGKYKCPHRLSIYREENFVELGEYRKSQINKLLSDEVG